jgi:tagaturonate epimerase
MSHINAFLLKNNLRIAQNPCVSPDFCLDWPSLLADIRGGKITEYAKSCFTTAAGEWTLLENARGDCAWKLHAAAVVLADGADVAGATVFPATWTNLLKLKNLIQEHNPASTIFPTAADKLGRSTLGVGARFTTLHWPAVEWAMSALEIGLTANQNSIPRELVYDVDAMLDNRLDTVPFPFIGTNVPEGHQGQSVEGMSHGCVLSKLKTGFHHRKIAWSFNADHQPIGGKFDAREDALVRGCLLASYITFDLSPELALNQPAKLPEIDSALVTKVRARVMAAGLTLNDADFTTLLCSVWPSLLKMKVRDEKYAAARAAAFSTAVGRTYLRELSIDELPGLTTPETTAIMLALCEGLGMPVNFVAPAFGFQKNTPYPDNAALKKLIEAQWAVCAKFGVSLGFHSGSGKSAENYQVMGQVTGGALEIKTSGRYTYEMGVALSQSNHATDAALWADWYKFTLSMAVAGAFSADATEQKMARVFVTTSLAAASVGGVPSPRGDDASPGGGTRPTSEVFASPAATRAALEALTPSAEHMFFFEYNFLYVLAAGGKPEKSALGDHTPAGYAQRARFYAVSPEARLLFSKRIAAYLIFLAENTGLASKERCAATSKLLSSYTTLDAMLHDISR